MSAREKGTIEQLRAKHALRCVEAAAANNVNYRSYVEGLPANIVMNGFGQAMATLKSKQKAPQDLLYEHVQDWLCKVNGPLRGNTLAQAIGDCDQTTYIHAQMEALAYLTWLKKVRPGDSRSWGEAR